MCITFVRGNISMDRGRNRDSVFRLCIKVDKDKLCMFPV